MPTGRPLPTVAHLQGYVDAVAACEWFEARWGPRRFEVRPGHGHRRATATRDGVLQLPRWARRELVVLHEMAHPLTADGVAPHGPEFAGILLALVRRAMGVGVAQSLEDAFALHRVRHVAPRPAPPPPRPATAPLLRGARRPRP